MKRKPSFNNWKGLLGLSAAFVTASAMGYLLMAEPDLNKEQVAFDTVGHGDVNTLKTALDAWRHNYEAKGGGPEVLKISLGYSKVISKQFTKARGRFELDLKQGNVLFQASAFGDGAYDLWIVDNSKGSALPEAGDKTIKIGSFSVTDGKASMRSQLALRDFQGFTLDVAVITEAGTLPKDGGVIAGAPDLMHKLYYADKPWLTTAMGDFNSIGQQALPFDFLLPKAAYASTVSDLTPVMGSLVAQGRELFHNETFGGNGRTCGTCHRADNNFTLDPNYIMNLPKSDPLFVAETNPALAELENPVLMRKHGLILTNVDGPDIDIYRSVPHTLALATTVKSESIAAGGEFLEDEDFANATGWGGDGAPGSGSLREFTLGAIAQHMPLSMNRIPGTDFRVPTEEELDAVEAYMLSLGRSKDYPLYQINFNDPLVQAGKDLFDTKVNPVDDDGPILGTTANCNGCHQNAGGRSSTTKANPTRDTGMEKMLVHPARLIKTDMAYDAGFGQTPNLCGPKRDQPCYGDGRFSTPPLIEAADTAPYFHNNAVNTLEEAIAAYNSDAFNTSPGSMSKTTDRRIKLDSSQVVAIASFLRTINALENIRLSDQLDNQAKQVGNLKTARELARLAAKENQDAIDVLKEGKLGTSWKAVLTLEKAAEYQRFAQRVPVKGLRNRMLDKAMALKQEARGQIASCDPDAAVPSTVKVPTPIEEYLFSCSELGL